MTGKAITAAGIFRRRFWVLTQIKEEREMVRLLFQVQERLRIHGFVVVGDRKMHMAAQG